uniref:Uncharacterized protein n=1 Tax=Anopheles darlingi TaxID=43151 RepID=A0A2M4D242_ANODA
MFCFFLFAGLSAFGVLCRFVFVFPCMRLLFCSRGLFARRWVWFTSFASFCFDFCSFACWRAVFLSFCVCVCEVEERV